MNEQEVRRDLARLDAPFIIVGRKPDGRDGRTTWAKTFPDIDAAATAAGHAEKAGLNVYVLRNPIVDGQLYRWRNREAGIRYKSEWGNPLLSKTSRSIAGSRSTSTRARASRSSRARSATPPGPPPASTPSSSSRSARSRP